MMGLRPFPITTVTYQDFLRSIKYKPQRTSQMGYFVLRSANITSNGKWTGGKEKGLRGVVVTISFPDKRHRNGKKVFLLQCNSSDAAARRQFKGTTLSSRIDASLSHSHIHRIALAEAVFLSNFRTPLRIAILFIYAYYAHLITISHVIIIITEFAHKPDETRFRVLYMRAFYYYTISG